MTPTKYKLQLAGIEMRSVKEIAWKCLCCDMRNPSPCMPCFDIETKKDSAICIPCWNRIKTEINERDLELDDAIKFITF